MKSREWFEWLSSAACLRSSAVLSDHWCRRQRMASDWNSNYYHWEASSQFTPVQWCRLAHGFRLIALRVTHTHTHTDNYGNMSALYQGIDTFFFFLIFSKITLMDGSWKSLLQSGQRRDPIFKVFGWCWDQTRDCSVIDWPPWCY